MPVHPSVSARFHFLVGISSFREAYAIPEQRRQIEQFETWNQATEPPTVPTRAETAHGPHGDIPLRVYTPSSGPDRDRPCLIWAHGGGFIGGDLDMREADWTAREVCARSGAVVVSVDYRRAVDEVAFPIPHDDVVAAVAWTRDRASDLGVDSARIAIGGASAGANLMAGAALRLRDRDHWLPASLVLSYPLLHPVIPPASPALAAALSDLPPALRMGQAGNALLSMNYVGGPLSMANGYAMPGIAVLEGLCPTLVLNAEYDDLRASGEAFTAALALAGVNVRQALIPGMLHGFLNLPAEVEPIARCLDLIAEVVRSTEAPGA